MKLNLDGSITELPIVRIHAKQQDGLLDVGFWSPQTVSLLGQIIGRYIDQ